MATERQKYTSTSLRNSGFAMMAPLASIIFQWVVFKKDLFLGHFSSAVILFLLGFLLIIAGYIALRGEYNEI